MTKNNINNDSKKNDVISKKDKITAIILAAGQGKRMEYEKNKIFIRIKKPIIIHTISAFEKNENIDEIFLVINKNEVEDMKKLVSNHDLNKVKKFIVGGETRQKSSYNGVKEAIDSNIVMVHDGARPFIRQNIIDKIIKQTNKFDACVVATPVKDTIKISKTDNFVEKTLDRSTLWAVQTPQSFKLEIIKKAHENALKTDFESTDETSLVEKIGIDVKLVKGDYDNIKITTPDDLFLADRIINENEEFSN